MATVEISHDEEHEAKILGPFGARTGRMRWWQAPNRERVLQAEWSNGRTKIWIAIPTITEITG